MHRNPRGEHDRREDHDLFRGGWTSRCESRLPRRLAGWRSPFFEGSGLRGDPPGSALRLSGEGDPLVHSRDGVRAGTRARIGPGPRASPELPGGALQGRPWGGHRSGGCGPLDRRERRSSLRGRLRVFTGRSNPSARQDDPNPEECGSRGRLSHEPAVGGGAPRQPASGRPGGRVVPASLQRGHGGELREQRRHQPGRDRRRHLRLADLSLCRYEPEEPSDRGSPLQSGVHPDPLQRVLLQRDLQTDQPELRPAGSCRPLLE
jgi:hypothetical protein